MRNTCWLTQIENTTSGGREELLPACGQLMSPHLPITTTLTERFVSCKYSGQKKKKQTLLFLQSQWFYSVGVSDYVRFIYCDFWALPGGCHLMLVGKLAGNAEVSWFHDLMSVILSCPSEKQDIKKNMHRCSISCVFSASCNLPSFSFLMQMILYCMHTRRWHSKHNSARWL